MRFCFTGKAQKPCFTYAAGKNSSSYKHDNFTPRFINKEELLSLSDNEAKQFCRDNIECLYDLWTTNIKQLAENTKIVKQTAEANTEFRGKKTKLKIVLLTPLLLCFWGFFFLDIFFY